VIDGQPLVRLGIRRLLSGRFAIEEAESRREALELIRDVGGFDVAILDMKSTANGTVNDIEATDAIKAIRRTEPGLGVVAYGDRAERHLATAALQAGATAYVSRGAEAEQLERAVEAALEDQGFIDPAVPPKGSRTKLTRRQRQLLQLIANGGSTTRAARELELSEETVKTHTKNILARLGARNRTHAVAIAIRESLIQ
jgi:DNA-binding NarL/FixJ family response regulator